MTFDEWWASHGRHNAANSGYGSGVRMLMKLAFEVGQEQKQEAVEAERERCAKLCEAEAERCAAAIRALK